MSGISNATVVDEDRADDDLTLAADVDHAGAERDADTDADEQQRHRLDRRVGERVPTPERTVEERGVALQRVGAEREQHHRADRERGDDGGERNHQSDERLDDGERERSRDVVVGARSGSSVSLGATSLVVIVFSAVDG